MKWDVFAAKGETRETRKRIRAILPSQEEES